MQSTVLEPRTAPAPPEVPTEEERVRNGAAFLDEHVPGWRERVDPVILRITSCTLCVLGQAFGDFFVGKQRLGLSRDRALRLGFLWNDAGYGFRREVSALNEAWRRELGCHAS